MSLCLPPNELTHIGTHIIIIIIIVTDTMFLFLKSTLMTQYVSGRIPLISQTVFLSDYLKILNVDISSVYKTAETAAN